MKHVSRLEYLAFCFKPIQWLLIVVCWLLIISSSRAQGFRQQTGANNPFNNTIGSNQGIGTLPTLVDIDGDGDLDVFSVDRIPTIFFYRNTGTKTAPVYTAADSPIGRPSEQAGDLSFQFVDLDGDGDLDAVTGNTDGIIITYRNTGSRTNPSFTQLAGNSNPFAGLDFGDNTAVSFADFDGDGDLDLLSLGSQIHYLRNTGTSTAPVYTDVTGADNPFRSVNTGAYSPIPAAADVDGDGDLDLVVSTAFTFDYYQNIGSKTSPVFVQLTGGANPLNDYSVNGGAISLGDVDGDGDPDAVGGYYSGNRNQNDPLLYLKNVLRLPQQPTPASSTVCAGTTVTTSVRATSDGAATYQWYRSAQNTSNPVAGQTSGTLSLTNVQPSDAGTYYALATGGGGALFSTAFTLTVSGAAITGQPASGSSVCAGASVTSFVSTSGTVSSYQWYRNGGLVSGQTSATLNLTNVQPAQAGNYIVVVTSCGSVTSSPFNLTVSAPPTVNLTNNGPLTCAQTSVTLTASATDGSTYAFSGPSGPIASSSTMVRVSSPGTYTVTASVNGCTSTTTTTVSSNTVTPTVSITPSATVICAGQSVTLNANASSGPLSYRWNTSATTSSISVSDTGPYSVTVTRSDNGCFATATASVTVNPLPTQYAVTGGGAYCAGSNGVAVNLSGSQTGLNYQLLRDDNPVGSPLAGTGNGLSFGNQTNAGAYTVQATNATTSCQQTMNGSAPVSITPLPAAPSLVTQSGYPYPAGQASLTITQNVGPVSLTVSGCSGGMIMANGNAASSFTISTAMTGTQTYTATCTQNGCTGPAGSFQLTVVPTTLSVLHRDADYGNLTNNSIKPYLELANAGGGAIPYSEVTVRYWFTSEGQAPPTNLAVYYAQLGAVNLKYVALSQPRQGAYGYVEYSFPGGGNLAANGNSGPIENGIQKTDGSNFNESDDYSYAANYQNYLPNARVTAYRNGTIIWGQEPTAVQSQTAVAVYSAAKDGTTTSQIQTRLELRNTGNVALPVSSLKLRYYFTSDNNQPANVYVDYADMGAARVAARVVKLPAPVDGADSYVELSFPGSTMQVNALSSLGVIDFRLVRSDNGLFNQSNDYSYGANYGNVGLNNRVTVLLDYRLIFGTPPTGAPARVGATEPVAVLGVQVLGNPVVGDQAQIVITGVAGQAVSLRLVDLQGRAIHEQRIEQAGETESVSVPLGQSRGQLLLRVSTDSQQQSVKLLRP